MKRKECNICNFKFDDFIPGGKVTNASIKYETVGMGYRPDRDCPNCLSRDRERALHFYIKEFIDTNKISSTSKVLHIAPEKYLKKQLMDICGKNYMAVDKLEDRYSYESDVVKFDLLKNHFESNSFDVIICNHVLEHVLDDDKAIKGLFRTIKNHGILIAQIPYSEKLQYTIEQKTHYDIRQREYFLGQDNHLRLYSLNDYILKLKENGFSVSSLSNNEKFGTSICEKFGLIKQEHFFLISKQ